jgi:hypothetical protein
VRRVLKPTGSAVFVLQPNSEKVGKMRPWLWDFMAWVCREWGIVQDAYWYNPQAMPTVPCQRGSGLLWPSVRMCIWTGPSNCFRNQDEVLVELSESTKKDKCATDSQLRYWSSTHPGRQSRSSGASVERGGVVPGNVLIMGHGGGYSHGSEMPLPLCAWWVRYLTPPGGLVLDPFAGSCTTGVAALRQGRRFLGIEQHQDYLHTARERFLTMSIKKEQP